MALVKITEESLRDAAGDGAYGQALTLADKVAGLSADGPLVEAAVDGVPVSLRIGQGWIEPRCGCPAPQPCLHAVATALAWVRTGDDEQVPDLFETLRVLDRDWLARQLAELAAADPALAARLVEAAGAADIADAAAEVTELRAEVADELHELEEEAGRYYDEWYPDTEHLGDLLDDAEALVDQAPDAVRDLADFVIEGIERVLDVGTGHGADLTDALQRAQDLHLEACLAGSPDPVRLAERPLPGAPDRGLGALRGAPPGHAHGPPPSRPARHRYARAV